MFEELINIENKGRVNSQWKIISDLSKKNDLQYRLRTKEKYGINDISYFGLIKTKNDKKPLVIVLVDLENDTLFLDSRDFSKTNEESVSLNNLIGALYKTINFQCLFVFELKNQGKFKLCYHPYKANSNDIKSGLSAQDARTNYSHVNVSLTPWIYTDFQSKRIKNAISQVNDLFKESKKKSPDELFGELQNIIKDISSDNIIASLKGEIIQEGSEYYHSPKRLFDGLDLENHPCANERTLAGTYLNFLKLDSEILSGCSKIKVHGNWKDVYLKIDVEDFWCALQNNPQAKKILDERKIEDLSDCFPKVLPEQPGDSARNEIVDISEQADFSDRNDEIESTNVISFTSFKDLPAEEYNKIREFAEIFESYEIFDGEKMKLTNGSEFFIDLNVRHFVTYYEAMYLCNKKSIQDGLNTCYEFSNPKVDHNELVFDVSEKNEIGYRLPIVSEIKELLNNETVKNKTSISDKIKILSGNRYKETSTSEEETDSFFLSLEPPSKLEEEIRKDKIQQFEESGEQWLYKVLSYGQTKHTKLCANERGAFLQMVKNIPESEASKDRKRQNDLRKYRNSLPAIKVKSELEDFKKQTETQKTEKISWHPRASLPVRVFLRTSEKQNDSIILCNDCKSWYLSADTLSEEEKMENDIRINKDCPNCHSKNLTKYFYSKWLLENPEKKQNSIPDKTDIDTKASSLPKEPEKIENAKEQIDVLNNRLKEIEVHKVGLESKMEDCTDRESFCAYENQYYKLDREYQNIKEKILNLSKNTTFEVDVSSMEKLLTIEKDVVLKCDEDVTDIVIPSGVKEIGESAFENCESLESVVIPDGITKIGSHAFSSCYSLKSIRIPSTVIEISTGAFKDCELLDSVVIPTGLKVITPEVFKGCKSLKEIIVPDSV
ncbi:MAG: leucine-rich repeat domain-containing protein, partial [Treponema sp.]|uniref:leucine-rich repeat domain-containing protein n=1 Tax=Treponema sp. TaxID=166 RepID=UPI002A914ADF